MGGAGEPLGIDLWEHKGKLFWADATGNAAYSCNLLHNEDDNIHLDSAGKSMYKYVMATEDGTWAVNNQDDGDLSHGWITLPAAQAHRAARVRR